MTKSNLLVAGLMLTGSALFAACNSDGTIGDGLGNDAGASNAGGGNTAGGTSLGEGGDAGAAVTPPGPLNPQTVVVPVEGPAKLNHLLVGGTNFSDKSEVVSVAIADGAIAKGDTYADPDAVAVSSAGVGFVLERTNDKLHIIENGKSTTTIDLTEAGTATTAIDNKAYVPFLGTSAIAIVDLGDG